MGQALAKDFGFTRDDNDQEKIEKLQEFINNNMSVKLKNFSTEAININDDSKIEESEQEDILLSKKGKFQVNESKKANEIDVENQQLINDNNQEKKKGIQTLKSTAKAAVLKNALSGGKIKSTQIQFQIKDNSNQLFQQSNNNGFRQVQLHSQNSQDMVFYKNSNSNEENKEINISNIEDIQQDNQNQERNTAHSKQSQNQSQQQLKRQNTNNQIQQNKKLQTHLSQNDDSNLNITQLSEIQEYNEQKIKQAKQLKQQQQKKHKQDQQQEGQDEEEEEQQMHQEEENSIRIQKEDINVKQNKSQNELDEFQGGKFDDNLSQASNLLNSISDNKSGISQIKKTTVYQGFANPEFDKISVSNNEENEVYENIFNDKDFLDEEVDDQNGSEQYASYQAKNFPVYSVLSVKNQRHI